MTRLLPSRRGQGTVELALGSLIFVTVLLFGIHFAELGVIKLRTQQAAASALWDTTGRRMHHLRQADPTRRFLSSNDLTGASDPTTRAIDNFRDFDRLTSGGSGIKLALTSGSRLDVTCQPAQVALLQSPPGRPAALTRLASAFDHPRASGRDVDGMECGGSARVGLFRVPTKFAEGSGGFFQAVHVKRPFIQVCAFGRARNGRCEGKVPIALDDWGLSGSSGKYGDENNECDHVCAIDASRGNLAYRSVVSRLYDKYLDARVLGGFNVDRFVRALFTENPAMPDLSSVPVDERDLRFNFIGEDGMPERRADTGLPAYKNKPFHFATREQDIDVVGAYNDSWASTPYTSKYQAGYGSRRECFLGMHCEVSIFDKRGGVW